MKSLEGIKRKIEEAISLKEYELYQIDSLINYIEETQNKLSDNVLSQFTEYKDDVLENRLAYNQSFLYTKSEVLENEISILEKENSFIQVSNGIYYLNSSYNYEDLYAFIDKYKDLFSFEDLTDIFINVKQIKIQQVIEEAKKEIPQEILELPIEESELISEEAMELAQELAMEEIVIEKKLETLTDKDRIMYFLELLANDSSEEDKELYIENMYNVIQNTNKKCKSFKDTSLYSFFKTNKNIYLAYRESNDIDNLKLWISKSLPEYTNYCSFEFFDKVIKSIENCDKYSGDYIDLTTLNSRDEIKELYSLIVSNGAISSQEFMMKLDFEFVKAQDYTEKNPGPTFRKRKNIIFYTPNAVKNGSDYFDDMQSFVESLSKNDWDAIYSSYSPNAITSVGGMSHVGFTQSEYMSLAAEYELRGITRVLGSRDTVNLDNRQRLMDYYSASDMEIISIHNIFTGPHNGADCGRKRSIGQYGYTPYYKYLNFFQILNKKEEWTDEEFAYICQVVDCCMGITSDIINGEKSKLSGNSKKLTQVLNGYEQHIEKKGQKS